MYGSDEDVKPETQKKFEVTIGDKVFALSLSDKIFALDELVNTTYADADNTFYSVIVYDEYLVMSGWDGKYYKQTYSEDNGNFTLIGERVQVYTEFVTEEELNSLNNMRANYEELVEFKKEFDQSRFNLDSKVNNVKVFANVNKSRKPSRYGNLFSNK